MSPPAKRGEFEEARYHRKTRQARSSEVAQDYVEAIADLIESNGEARVVDIARRLGVTHVTVNRTVARLQRDKLVNSERYRSVFLTPSGEALADEVRHRHRIVLEFLEVLGVAPEVARTDAEGIEHHVSSATLNAFEQFVRANNKTKQIKRKKRKN